MEKVLVIGAGCAGLSAATLLAQKGYQVEVLEKSRIVGGRTSSVADPDTGEPVDNGQHMFLGCYKQTNAFLRRIGATQHVVYRDGFETLMMGQDGQKAFLKTFKLPAPFHLLFGYMKYKAFSFKERLSIVHVVHGLKKYTEEDLTTMSCTNFLNKCKQSQKTQERFWNLVILATLNIAPEKAPANLLKVVMEQGFMSSRQDSASGLANIGLSDLFGEYSKSFLEQRKSHIRTKHTVDELVIENNKVKGVTLLSGEMIVADHIVCAVPPRQTLKLLQGHRDLLEACQDMSTLQSSPIVSLNIWVGQDLFEDAYVGFWDTDFHWVFRKSVFMKDSSIKHYTLVASGADKLVHATTDELVAMAKKTLFPLCGDVDVVRAKKSLMKEATWIPPLGNTKGRLKMNSDIDGLYFAGDWVDTGLPCTIESACLSGHNVANLIAATKPQ